MKPCSEIVEQTPFPLDRWASLLPILSTSHSCLVEAGQHGRVDSVTTRGVGKLTAQDTCLGVTATYLCLRSLFAY